MIEQTIRRVPGWARWLLPLAVLLLAFGLRLYRLDNQSFAFDEGWTSYAIHHSWRAMWGVLGPDNHPPSYYVLVKAFADLAGYGDVPLRFFSVMCGMVLIAGLYALGRRLGGEMMGVSAALFAACAPSFVYYAQEARMYSLLMALAVLSLYSLLRFGEDPGRRRWWVAYVLTTAAALYTHYFAALLLIAQNVLWTLWIIYGLVRRHPQRKTPSIAERVRWWVLGQAVILVLYLPWVPTAIRQVSIGQGTWWRMPLPATVIARDIWRFYVLGPRRPAGVPPFGPWLGAIALAGLVALFLGWRRRPGAWAFVLATLVVPVGLVILVGSHFPVYTDRYTLVAAPGLALIVGLGVTACWEALTEPWAWLGRVAAVVLLVAVVIAPLPQLLAAYDDPTYWREDFRRAAAYLKQEASAGDTVIMLGSWQPITHYYRGPAQLLRFPQSGDSVQSEEEVVSLLREHIQPGGRVRLVMFSWETVDPQSLVEGQLRAHCEIRGEHWQRETGQRPIRVMNFAACDGDFSVEPRRSLEAVWDDQVALDGYRLVNLSPGRQAHVVLWWRTLRRPDRDYSAFVHLLDDQGQIIKQFDKLPLSDFYPMRAWPPNVEQRDDYPLNIPAEADLEGAWLAIGLYDARNGRRLPVVQGGIPVGDFIRVPVVQ